MTVLFDDGSDRLGYLLKENISNLDELRRAISTVCSGGSSIDPEVVDVMVGRKRTSSLGDLTERRARGARTDRRGAEQRGDR